MFSKILSKIEKTRPSKILLVEDEPIIAMSEANDLKKYGYEVLIANNGEDAIAKTQTMPDLELILMDIDLGSGIDGTQAAQIILADLDIPIVFLSSHAEPEIVAKTEKITSYGYIFKNSGITVLDASIKMAFKLFAAHKNIQEHSEKINSINDSLQKALDQVIRSEEKFFAIFNMIPDSVAITDTDTGKIIDINESFEKWSGYSRSELVGKTTTELKFWLTPEERTQTLAKTKDSGALDNALIKLRIKTGEIKDTFFSTRILDLGYKKVLLTRIHDISDYLKIERSVEEINKLYDAIFNNIPIGVALTTKAGKLLKGNKMLYKLHNISPEEFELKGISDMYKNPQERMQMLAELKAKGKVSDLIVELVKGQTESFTAKLTIVPVHLQGEQDNVLLTIMENVNNNKK